jgi:hypothetical protein
VPMADEEHLQILQQAVDVWNEWRKSNPELIPDLDGATLYEANLYQGEPKRGEPKRGEAKRGEAQGGGPYRGEPHRGGSQEYVHPSQILQPGRTSRSRVPP